MDHTRFLDLLTHYDSYYLYDEAGIRAAIDRLHTHFPGAQFLYSVKCNPAGKVLDTIFSAGVGADAASLWEVEAALQRGVPARLIHYSAPGRPEADLRKAYGRCVMIADSLRDIAILADEAQRRGEVAEIGVRINPNFTFTANEGVPGKFGIDEESFFAADLSHVRVRGIHVHAKSQELCGENLTAYYAKMFALVERIQQHIGAPLDYANFGSGLGVPYTAEDTELDVAAVGAQFQTLLADFRTRFPAVQICIETGRYLTCKQGVYVTKVLDKKVSRGKTFVLLSSTLNGFVRPAVAQMMRGLHSPACEPMFTHEDAFRYIPLVDDREPETVTLCGNLCTATDAIVHNITLPRLEIGDAVLMTNAGSYAAVLSPMQFAHLTPPAQLLLAADGSVYEC